MTAGLVITNVSTHECMKAWTIKCVVNISFHHPVPLSKIDCFIYTYYPNLAGKCQLFLRKYFNNYVISSSALYHILNETWTVINDTFWECHQSCPWIHNSRSSHVMYSFSKNKTIKHNYHVQRTRPYERATAAFSAVVISQRYTEIWSSVVKYREQSLQQYRW